MSDEMKMQLAQQVYQTLCSALERNEWTYEKEEDKLIVHFGLRGEDLPMRFALHVDPVRQMVTLLSPMPFEMSESKRMEGAIAVGIANFGMLDGSFDYDLSDGSIAFRMTACFMESQIGEGLFHYMIGCTAAMVERYNEKFYALDQGAMSLAEFLTKE
jgi:hypothetical protein